MQFEVTEESIAAFDSRKRSEKFYAGPNTRDGMEATIWHGTGKEKEDRDGILHSAGKTNLHKFTLKPN